MERDEIDEALDSMADRKKIIITEDEQTTIKWEQHYSERSPKKVITIKTIVSAGREKEAVERLIETATSLLDKGEDEGL